MLSVRARERLSRKTRVAMVAALLGGAALAAWALYARPHADRQLAECIARSGTVLYGTFWCEDCATQKELAAEAAALLPYFECSTPDGQRQKDTCRAAGITRYPTWVFPEGARHEGILLLTEAAARAGCTS